MTGLLTVVSAQKFNHVNVYNLTLTCAAEKVTLND